MPICSSVVLLSVSNSHLVGYLVSSKYTISKDPNILEEPWLIHSQAKENQVFNLGKDLELQM